MINVKLSVIIPVFNTKEYLSECIESVLSQSLKQLEIIIVDDGSTDGSQEVALRYASAHNNVKYYVQERKRQGAARNLGLSHAQGIYVAFLDSDDLVPCGAYETMVSAADLYRSDIVVGIIQSFSGNSQKLCFSVHKREFTTTREVVSVKDMPSLLEDVGCCNKIFRRSVIVDNKIFFPEGIAVEDLDFMARLYLIVNKVTVLPVVVYNYRAREGSGTHRIDLQYFADRLYVAERLESFYNTQNQCSLYAILLRSEVRKLVKNRLSKVIRYASYFDSIKILEYMSKISIKLSDDMVVSSNYYSFKEQIRIIMLKFGEYDALIKFEKAPFSTEFTSELKSESVKKMLFEPIVSLYCENIKGLSRLQKIKKSKIYNIAVKFRNLVTKSCKILKRAELFGLIKFFVLYFKEMLFPISCSKNTWLIDERISSSAEDNGYFFFKYLRENCSEINAYYVIKKNSPHLPYINSIGNAVILYSWKHVLLLFRSKVFISTDSFSGICFPYERFPSLRRQVHNVFLQHGVAGNKTMTYTKQRYPYFSQVIVSNEREKEFFSKHYGFNEREVTLTGIARFDNLAPIRSSHRSRIILAAPTWRRWLKKRASIYTSRYYAYWNEVMTSPILADLLDRYDATLCFRPHFNMMHFIDEFENKSSRVKILRDINEPLHHLIKKADLLITDYSSVMYDFFYQEKPVVAYMFDRREWEEQPPGPPHLSYDTDLALNIVYSPSEVFQEIEYYAANNFEMRPCHLDRLSSLFSYRDGDNCRRIFNSILSRL